jgi:hypothetical protein
MGGMGGFMRVMEGAMRGGLGANMGGGMAGGMGDASNNTNVANDNEEKKEMPLMEKIAMMHEKWL